MVSIINGFSTVNKTRAPYSLSNEELVVQDLLNEFHTRKGERVMRPNFGFIGWDLLMEIEDSATEETFKEDIIRIIDKEPRAEHVNTILYISDHTIRAEVVINFLLLNLEETLYLEFTRTSNQDTV